MPGCNLSDFTHHQVDDAHFLLHRSGKVLGVNPTAACIWSLISDGASPAETAAELAEALAITAAEAQAAVDSTIANLEQAVGGQADQPLRTISDRTRDLLAAEAVYSTRHYLLSGRTLKLSYCSADVEQMVHPLISHLECKPGLPGLEVQIQEAAPGDYFVVLTKLQWGPVKRELVTHSTLSMLPFELSQQIPFQLAVHASAVSCNGKAMVFPGMSGAGKSTLAAGLAKRGFEYLADDSVFVEAGDYSIYPYNVPSGAKQNVWSFLSGEYPRLKDTRVYDRLDGRKVKYLRLALPHDVLRKRCAVGAIVFPQYLAGSKTILKPLPLADVVKRLVVTGYSMREGATRADFLELIAWIKSIRTCSLTYSNLDEAAESLRRLQDTSRLEDAGACRAAGGEMIEMLS